MGTRGRMESLGLPAVTLGDGTTAYLQQAAGGNRASGCQRLLLALKWESGSPKMPLTVWELPHGQLVTVGFALKCDVK